MEIIHEMRLETYAQRRPDAESWLIRWRRIVEAGAWRSIKDVHQTFGSADAVKVRKRPTVTIFNAAGNKYRLITRICYDTQRVYVLQFLTHAAYSKNLWKNKL